MLYNTAAPCSGLNLDPSTSQRVDTLLMGLVPSHGVFKSPGSGGGGRGAPGIGGGGGGGRGPARAGSKKVYQLKSR
jgi:hypothetical protein